MAVFGLYLSVPVACWRRGQAREFLESEPLPPPSTCYGFLLSLVGEEDRERHRGVRVTAGRLRLPDSSLVLRTVWRVKDRRVAPGVGTNARPDFQQLLCGNELVLWVDSPDEPISAGQATLEERVREALNDPSSVARCGGLSLGESTHLVDVVRTVGEADLAVMPEVFLLYPEGAMSLPVWVDHVGSKGTRYARGSLERLAERPVVVHVPRIPTAVT